MTGVQTCALPIFQLLNDKIGRLDAGPLLHAEVRGGQVNVDVGRVGDGGHVPRPVPGGADAELLGENLQLPGGGDAPDLADVDPYVVDELFGDDGLPLPGVVEQLAVGDGDAGLPAEVSQPVDLLQGDRLLQVEQVEGLQLFGQADGVDRGDALVNVEIGRASCRERVWSRV